MYEYTFVVVVDRIRYFIKSLSKTWIHSTNRIDFPHVFRVTSRQISILTIVVMYYTFDIAKACVLYPILRWNSISIAIFSQKSYSHTHC